MQSLTYLTGFYPNQNEKAYTTNWSI